MFRNTLPKFTLSLLAISLIIGVIVFFPAKTMAQSPNIGQQLQAIAHAAEEGALAAKANDITKTQHEYLELHKIWENIEDTAQAQNSIAYFEIETAIHAVRDAVQIENPTTDTAYESFESLERTIGEFSPMFINGETTSIASTNATPADALNKLDELSAALEKGDSTQSAKLVSELLVTWLAIEGDIATRSPEAYTAVEVDLGKTIGAINASPADLPAAKSAVDSLRATLSPFATVGRYTALDATAVILREGLEALLVIVALLAFLKKSGNTHRQNWIWGGATLGLVASLGTAFVLQALFSKAIAGQNRELIEGITGLVAASLLFYVSYWMHNKSNAKAWQKYLGDHTATALAKGSMFGLASLSFLAIFREGAETTIFYLGMAPTIAQQDLWTGLGAGIFALAIAAFLIFKLGMQLPIAPFFKIAGLLVYYLGFKFLGTGIHALQISGVLSISPVKFLNPLPAIGVYPTWEVILPQFGLLLLAITVILLARSQTKQVPITSV